MRACVDARVGDAVTKLRVAGVQDGESSIGSVCACAHLFYIDRLGAHTRERQGLHRKAGGKRSDRDSSLLLDFFYYENKETIPVPARMSTCAHVGR